MRFAGYSVLTQEEAATIPSLEARLGLEAGDRVALYELVRHSSMGEGVSPIFAVVLGSHEPGWFIGETEDGSQVEFHADQVIDIERHPPSMGGLADFIRNLNPFAKKEEKTGLPALPVEKKKLFAFKAPEEQEEFFLIERPTSELIPEKKEEKKLFSFKAPEIEEAALIERPSTEIAPAKKETFVFKAPEEVPFLETPEVTLFPEAIEVPVREEVPPTGFLTPYRPEETIERFQVVPQHLEPEEKEYVKVLPLPPRRTLLPSVEDVARGFLSWYDTEDLWDMIRKAREEPYWKEELRGTGIAKFMTDTLGSGSGDGPTTEEEVASFFNIPWSEFEKRSDIETYEYEGKKYQERYFMDDVREEILYPLSDIVYERL